MKRWIAVDLDGTLADHYWPDKGDFEPLRIGDPIPAMVARVRDWLAQGKDVRIFTARVGPHPTRTPAIIEEIRAAIRAWTHTHVGVALEATCIKDEGLEELWDDRAVRVIHNRGIRCCEPAA